MTSAGSGGTGKRVNPESVAGGILLLYSAVYLVSTFTIPASSGENTAVGPAVLPAVIGAGLLLVALALLVRGLLSGGGRSGGEASGGPENRDSAAVEVERIDEEAGEGDQDPRRLLVVAGLLLGYIVLFLPLGYVLSTFLFLFLTTTYLDRSRLVRNVVYAVVFSVGVYYLFSQVLEVTLPVSPVGI